MINNFGRVISVNGLLLSPESGGISWQGGVRVTSGPIAQNVETRPRGDESLTWVKGKFAGRPLELHFRGGDASDLPRLLAAIEPSSGAWMLRAEMEDGDAALIDAEVEVATTTVNQFGDSLTIQALQLSPTWQSTDETTATLTTGSADGALALAIDGHTKTRPVITLKPTALRSTTTTAKGWKYRRTLTLTNNGAETIDRFPFLFYIGSTTTEVGNGKMQADGDDVRIWFAGEDLPRTLVGMNSANTYAWAIIDGFAPGESRTYEFVYGNASATNPPTLAYPDLPPFDLTASVNASWVYNTDETTGHAGKGLWYINQSARTPGRVDFDVPGAWRRFLMLENRDDYNQSRHDAYTATGTKYHAILDAERRREGSVRLQDEGQADGIFIHVPTGIQKLNANFRYLNIAQNSDNLVGTGKAVIMAREGGGESWETVFERSDVQNSVITIAATDYTVSSPYPKELYLGVLPQDEIEIPQSCRGTSKCQLMNSFAFTLYTNTANVIAESFNLTEANIWDAYGTLEVAPGGDAPRSRVDLGGAGDSGRLAVPLNNTLMLDGERRTIEEWNSTMTALVARREFAGVFTAIDADGNEAPTHDWLVAKPHTETIDNGDFDTTVSPWAALAADAGITRTFTVDTSVFHTGPGSAKIAISANTGASGALVSYTNPTRLACVPGSPLGLVFWVRTSNANIEPIMQVQWFDVGGNFLGFDRQATWTPTIDTWTERVYAPVAPAGAVEGELGILARNRSASPGAGNVYFDDITDDNVLAHIDLDTSVVVTAEWRSGWYG